tara:strand:- start:4749 stop:4943 length:195 start_codon:yes stop_codon:yes gene_type:complete
MTTMIEAYEAFIGQRSVEDDASWSFEVWEAAWLAAIESFKGEANVSEQQSAEDSSGVALPALWD